MNTPKYPEAHRTLYEVSGDITDHNTVLVNRAELRRLHEQNQMLLGSLKLLKIAIKVGMPEYSYDDWIDLIDTAIAEVEGKI